MKTFSDERKLRKFITSRNAIKEMSKEILKGNVNREPWIFRRQGKATEMINMWINIKDFLFLPEDFKIDVPVESKNYNIAWWGFPCV